MLSILIDNQVVLTKNSARFPEKSSAIRQWMLVRIGWCSKRKDEMDTKRKKQGRGIQGASLGRFTIHSAERGQEEVDAVASK